jgi:hypothetical protein
MPGIAHHPSTRTVSARLRWLRALVLAVCALLLLASSAQAAEAGVATGETHSEPPTSGSTGETSTPPSGNAGQPVEGKAGGGEAPVEVKTGGGEPVEVKTGGGEVPVEVKTGGGEPPAETKPPAETPAETKPPVETPPVTTPPPETVPTPVLGEGTGGVPLSSEETHELLPKLLPGKEEAHEPLLSSGGGASSDSEDAVHGGTATAPTGPASTGASSGEGTPGLSSSLPLVATVGGPGETLAESAAHGAAVGASAVAAAGQLIGEASCNLGRSTSICGAGPSSVAGVGSGSVVPLAGGSLIAAVTGSGGDDEHGGTPGGSRPGVPAPAPAPSPGGASGAAASGGTGLGLSGFITLGALLGLAAPRALRRLRLASEPWLSPSFALIPERPD